MTDNPGRSTADILAAAARRGLFRVGLPAPWGDDGGYAAIASTVRDLTQETGDPAIGMAFAVRQLVGRSFVAAHGSAAQQAQWMPQLAAGEVPVSLAISEAGAGAHPKLLTTRASRVDGGWRLTGQKAWVTNAPVAKLILVLAIVAEEAGRKRYGFFLVPRDAPGLDIQAGADAGKHGAHCPVALNDVVLTDDAVLQVEGDAYTALALPFRTLEDSIGLSAQAAAFHLLLADVAAHLPADGAADAELGQLVGFAALFDHAAAAAARALDAGGGRDGHDVAALVGVKGLLPVLLERVRALPGDGAQSPRAARLLAWFDLMATVARRARAAYTERLGAALRQTASQ